MENSSVFVAQACLFMLSLSSLQCSLPSLIFFLFQIMKCIIFFFWNCKGGQEDGIREYREGMPKRPQFMRHVIWKIRTGQYVHSTQMRPCKDAWRIARVSQDTSRRSTIKPYYVGTSDIDCRFKPLKLIHLPRSMENMGNSVWPCWQVRRRRLNKNPC